VDAAALRLGRAHNIQPGPTVKTNRPTEFLWAALTANLPSELEPEQIYDLAAD